MKTIILGAGLSGISTAYFLQKYKDFSDITILEKENRPCGLCRSIKKDGYTYDIGPHILFSKDKEMLELMLSVLDDGKNDLIRSNQILYKGKRIQYPFENDLSKLPKEELNYCINAFNHNPYENYDVNNMIQFFLKTFGEGITNTYLRPYNEKIWKYDPAFMNTSMVDRIPKPTDEEIRRSAAGETIQGYLHQLYFSFPTKGGIEAVPQGFIRRLDREKCRIELNSEVTSLTKKGKKYEVIAGGKKYDADLIISTIPVQALTKSFVKASEELKNRINKLRYNSIIISFVKLPYDLCGDNFAFMIPDKDVIFHRISKMDFLGDNYHHSKNEATYMVEVTYRKNDQVDLLSEKDFKIKICEGLQKIGFAKDMKDIEFIDITKYDYAYVIYDLDHTKNMDFIRKYYNKQGIILNGRFGNFEYWNMDRILRESYELSKRLEENIINKTTKEVQ
jgi:protoporphyrinogen oxidase